MSRESSGEVNEDLEQISETLRSSGSFRAGPTSEASPSCSGHYLDEHARTLNVIHIAQRDQGRAVEDAESLSKLVNIPTCQTEVTGDSFVNPK